MRRVLHTHQEDHGPGHGAVEHERQHREAAGRTFHWAMFEHHVQVEARPRAPYRRAVPTVQRGQ